MNRLLAGLFVLTLLLAATPEIAQAQTFPTPDYWRTIALRPAAPSQLPQPEGLKDFVVEGKLRLGLADAIRLVLLNNTEVQINRLNYEGARFSILRAYAPFDPLGTASFNARRSTTPTASQIDGAPTLSSLGQNTSFSFSQLLQTGTAYNIQFNASRDTTNSVFATFNPSLFTSMNFTVQQPLLRNRGLFPNRAPIVIARRNLRTSHANFETQVSDAVQRAVNQYWAVVQARENLKVQQRALELSEATYARNKRELELGAIPPHDIYRSESQVATRRVQVIQAEYDLKQIEDDFRRTIGADLDDFIRALDLDLTESPQTLSEEPVLDATQALERAMARRPELEAARQQLANDDDGIRLAHNSLQPDLNLSGFYQSSGRGGNEIDTSVQPPVVVDPGGLSDALGQLGRFDFPSYGFTVSLRLPIRNRNAEAEMGNALVAKRRSLYQMRQREQAVLLEVRNAVHELEKAKLSVAASRIARDLSQKNLEAETRKYELGVTTIFFVLDAQTQLANAEVALVQAEISYQRALTGLHRATGDILEAHSVQIQEVKP